MYENLLISTHLDSILIMACRVCMCMHGLRVHASWPVRRCGLLVIFMVCVHGVGEGGGILWSQWNSVPTHSNSPMFIELH